MISTNRGIQLVEKKFFSRHFSSTEVADAGPPPRVLSRRGTALSLIRSRIIRLILSENSISR